MVAMPIPMPKRVLDFNGMRVGDVREVVRDGRTGEPRSLLIGLSPEARAQLGRGSFVVRVPVQFIAGVRREEVALDRSLREVARGMPPAE